jgi:hypothetical protein
MLGITVTGRVVLSLARNHDEQNAFGNPSHFLSFLNFDPIIVCPHSAVWPFHGQVLGDATKRMVGPSLARYLGVTSYYI